MFRRNRQQVTKGHKKLMFSYKISMSVWWLNDISTLIHNLQTFWVDALVDRFLLCHCEIISNFAAQATATVVRQGALNWENRLDCTRHWKHQIPLISVAFQVMIKHQKGTWHYECKPRGLFTIDFRSKHTMVHCIFGPNKYLLSHIF